MVSIGILPGGLQICFQQVKTENGPALYFGFFSRSNLNIMDLKWHVFIQCSYLQWFLLVSELERWNWRSHVIQPPPRHVLHIHKYIYTYDTYYTLMYLYICIHSVASLLVWVRVSIWFWLETCMLLAWEDQDFEISDHSAQVAPSQLLLDAGIDVCWWRPEQ